MKCNCPTPRLPYTHTLTVEALTTTADDNGQIDSNDDDNWTAEGRIRGRFETRMGDESSRTDTSAFRQKIAVQESYLYSPKTALTDGLSPAKRLRLGTRVFHITAAYLINETGREVKIHLTERKR